MKCIEEGHVYAVDNYTAPPGYQKITFMKRVNGEMVMDGTTNEEILEMMIDRMEYLNAKLPCRENESVIARLLESLMLLNRRTELRKEQQVETKDIPHV